MKIAIIGLGDTKEEAPIDDPEWIKYGLPWDDNFQKYDCLFEMHQPELLQLPLAGVCQNTGTVNAGLSICTARKIT